jgi:hypothetical protein
LETNTEGALYLFLAVTQERKGKKESKTERIVQMLITHELRMVTKQGEEKGILQATNLEEGMATTAENEENDSNALVQFELYEVLVRLSFEKYINSNEMNDASDALDRLMKENVLSKVPGEVLVDPNHFRFNRMYTKEVEGILVQYDEFLEAIFQVCPFLSLPAQV